MLGQYIGQVMCYIEVRCQVMLGYYIGQVMCFRGQLLGNQEENTYEYDCTPCYFKICVQLIVSSKMFVLVYSYDPLTLLSQVMIVCCSTYNSLQKEDGRISRLIGEIGLKKVENIIRFHITANLVQDISRTCLKTLIIFASTKQELMCSSCPASIRYLVHFCLL